MLKRSAKNQIRKYEFHRPGRKPTSGRVKSTGVPLGGRMSGRSERVIVEVERKGKRKNVPLAEKVFFERLFDCYKPKNVFILNKLRKLGLNAIPTAKLAIEKTEQKISRIEREERARQIMTDLTRGGRFKVVDYQFEGMIESEVRRLTNLKEIQAQIQREEQTANQHGFALKGKEWLIVIDPITKTGKPYIVDVKTVKLNQELERELIAWLKKLDL